MVKRTLAFAISFILASMTLSGCLSGDNDSTAGVEGVDTEDENPPFFEEGDYRCFEHDEETRCWITHVPESVNGSEPVPLLLDLHGWSLSADR